MAVTAGRVSINTVGQNTRLEAKAHTHAHINTLGDPFEEQRLRKTELDGEVGLNLAKNLVRN